MFYAKYILTTALVALAMAATASPTARQSTTEYCVPQPATTWTQEQAFTGFINDFFIARDVPKAFTTYVAFDFIQHSPFEPPYGPNGSEAYLIPIFSNPAIHIEILHSAFDSSIGMLHYRIDGYTPLPTAIVDIFRFNGTCIQEHWDVVQTLPANATNPIALF